MGTNLYTLHIKKYRKNLRHMTQEELAYKCNISPSYISMLEQDNITRSRSPSLALIRDIAYALEVCPNEIANMACVNCQLNNNKCPKKKYITEDEEDFYKDNFIYYL